MADATLLLLVFALAFSVWYLIHLVTTGTINKNSKVLIDPVDGKVYSLRHEGINTYYVWEIVTPDSLKNWEPNVKSQVNNTNN